MSVQLTEDEAWKVVESAHTGILTTLRRDGSPVSLPVWFVSFDRHVYIRANAESKKVTRLRHDARASFLVESGERWAELEAVHLTGRADVLANEGPEAARFEAEFNLKYAAFRTLREEMPDSTRAHYEVSKSVIRFVANPDQRILSWDNRRLGFL
jgi:nitroimidazol reductase NimA-like FMN-containing flavoprotein (pyridoxamine 5'-phosphate oxidase superfamily)